MRAGHSLECPISLQVEDEGAETYKKKTIIFVCISIISSDATCSKEIEYN